MTYKDRNNRLLFEDMLTSSDKIIEYTKTFKSFSDFVTDLKATEAVQYNLIIIGEASKNISDEVKEKFRNIIPFEEISGLRNRLVHDYLGTDYSLIWEIVASDIPKLKEALETILDDENQF